MPISTMADVSDTQALIVKIKQLRDKLCDINERLKTLLGSDPVPYYKQYMNTPRGSLYSVTPQVCSREQYNAVIEKAAPLIQTNYRFCKQEKSRLIMFLEGYTPVRDTNPNFEGEWTKLLDEKLDTLLELRKLEMMQ